MKLLDLTIPFGVATPPWPTYEPLQLKYFKRLAPNGANGQLLTHSNHVGTHLDGEIHFYTPGKDIAQLDRWTSSCTRGWWWISRTAPNRTTFTLQSRLKSGWRSKKATF